MLAKVDKLTQIVNLSSLETDRRIYLNYCKKTDNPTNNQRAKDT
jgi:hypothetical protein